MNYISLANYFKEKYGKRLSKICIDAGFTCPNRDGKCGTGGCIYCGERGAGEHILENTDIEAQVRSALDGKPDDSLFVAYFQNFTNTYAPVEVLKQKYDSALFDDRIKVLAIGTRPDCIDEDVARLISSYRERCDVWVELGLQTANDETARLINRGYDRAVFDKAMKILEKYSIPVVVHIIIGLPGEGFEDVRETVTYLNRYKLFGLKIHSIYVMRGTRLAEMLERGEYAHPTMEEYVERAVWALANINRGTVIHRLTGDCPQGMLIAPKWNADKNSIIDKIRKNLEKM